MNSLKKINKYNQKQILDLIELKRKLKDNSGLLSRMKERDRNEKLNKICLENYKKRLDKLERLWYNNIKERKICYE